MLLASFRYHPGAAPVLSWTWDPLPCFGIAALLLAYVAGVGAAWRAAGRGRAVSEGRAACGVLGLVVAWTALVSPLDQLSEGLFAAHMSQHELLMVVAAPLVVLGRPFLALVWVLPSGARPGLLRPLRSRAWRGAWEVLSAPLFVLVLHAFTRWVWHLPSWFEAAMRHETLHAFQHVTFFATAALFWWALVHGRYGRAGYGLGVLFVFATALHTSILGALITVAPRLIYGIYRSRTPAYGWQPLEDQELAGLIMWIPSGLLFLICALALFAAWLGEAERRGRRSAVVSAPPPLLLPPVR